MHENSAEEAQSPLYTACPFLGSADDRNTRAIFPSETSGCFSDPDGKSVPIHLEHQAQFCLNGNHVQCPRFLGLDDTPRVVAQPEKPPRRWSTRARTLYALGMVALVALVLLASWRVFNTAQTANADAEDTVAVVSAETPLESETNPALDASPVVDEETTPVNQVEEALVAADEADTEADTEEAAGDDPTTDTDNETPAVVADVNAGVDGGTTAPNSENARPDTGAAADTNGEAQLPADAVGDVDDGNTASADDMTTPEAAPNATPDPAIPLILPPTATPETDDVADDSSAQAPGADETSEGDAEAATEPDESVDESIADEDESAETVTETAFVLSFPGGNLRTGPSTGNPIITVVPEGTAVLVLGRTPAYWFYVRLDNGVEGWLAYSVFQQPDAAQAAAVPIISP